MAIFPFSGRVKSCKVSPVWLSTLGQTCDPSLAWKMMMMMMKSLKKYYILRLPINSLYTIHWFPWKTSPFPLVYSSSKNIGQTCWRIGMDWTGKWQHLAGTRLHWSFWNIGIWPICVTRIIYSIQLFQTSIILFMHYISILCIGHEMLPCRAFFVTVWPTGTFTMTGKIKRISFSVLTNLVGFSTRYRHLFFYKKALWELWNYRIQLKLRNPTQ